MRYRSRSSAASRQRRGRYRPCVELLEGRVQPGSLLGVDLEGLTHEEAVAAAWEYRRRRREANEGLAGLGGTTNNASPAADVVVAPPDSGSTPSTPPAPLANTEPPAPPVVQPPAPAAEEPPLAGLGAGEGTTQANAGVARADRGVVSPSVKPLPLSQSANGGAEGSIGWASYMGGPGLDWLRDAVMGPGGLYVAGYIADPDVDGVTDMLVAKVSFDGTTLLNAVALNFPDAIHSEARALDIDSDGNMYVIGVSDFQGFGARTYLRLDNDWQTVRWTRAASVPSEGNGILHDDNTFTIYTTGMTDARSIDFPETSLQVSWFYDLESWSGPESIFSYVYAYDGFSGADGNSIAIGPDSTLQVAGAFRQGDNIYPALHEISGDGEVANGIYFEVPGQGSLDDVYVDAAGGIYATGNIAAENDAGRKELLITKFSAGLNVQYAYSFGSEASQLTSYGIRADALGQAYVVGSITSEPGNADLLVARFSADGSEMTDAVVLGGPHDDVALAIDMDPNSSEVFIVGYTISDDLEITPDSFQPGFGGLLDGFVMKLTDFA